MILFSGVWVNEKTTAQSNKVTDDVAGDGFHTTQRGFKPCLAATTSAQTRCDTRTRSEDRIRTFPSLLTPASLPQSPRSPNTGPKLHHIGGQFLETLEEPGRILGLTLIWHGEGILMWHMISNRLTNHK